MLFVGSLVFWVQPAKLMADELGIPHGIFRIQPEVRIGMTPILREAEVEDIVCFGKGLVAQKKYRGPPLLVGPGKIQSRDLKVEPVEYDEVGLGQELRVRWDGFEGVGIHPFGDDTGHAGPIPGDVLHHAGNWGNSGDDLELFTVRT